MTERTDPGIPPDDDEDDYDDEVQATPQPPIVHDLQKGIQILRYGIAAISQFESMGSSSLNTVSAASHIRAFEQIRADAGVVNNPMEQILVDGAMLAHVQAARLMSKAEGQPPEVAEVYHNASAKYLGETRKLALALKEFRSPVVAKQVTVVQQQNVAHGDQQVACLTANVTPMASLPAVFSDEFATVITEAYGSVAAITHEQKKSTDELIIESFMATPEVREHLSQMDAAVARQFETQEVSCRSINMADVILSTYGARSDSIGV